MGLDMKRFFVVLLLVLLECGCGHVGALYLPRQSLASQAAVNISNVHHDKEVE